MEEEKDKGKEPELAVDEQAMLQMLVEANALERGGIRDRLVIDGKAWKMRATSKWQNKAMHNHDIDILNWQIEQKNGASRKHHKELNGKIQKAFCKKAAHCVLGKRLWLVPFAFLLTWLRIYNASERVSGTINAWFTYSQNRSFYFANWGSSKEALARYMTSVGNAVKQMQEREASAESMLDEDASPKKEEDSKSARPSKARGTTRR